MDSWPAQDLEVWQTQLFVDLEVHFHIVADAVICGPGSAVFVADTAL